MRSDKITLETVQHLVDAFYAKVRQDDQLGPIFERAIGTSAEAWQPHLQVMYAFWSTLMCKTGYFDGAHLQYKGTPLQKHQNLPPFDEALFARWLALFHETASELHTEGPAQAYIDASTRVAESLKLSLYVRPANLAKNTCQKV